MSNPQDTYTAKNLDTKADLKTQVEDLCKFVDDHKTLMFTTICGGKSLTSRPMVISERTNEVDFLFFTDKESQKVEEFKETPHVNLAIYSDSDKSWASISGEASLIEDREKIHKLYQVYLKAWLGDKGDGVHDGGKDDPRIVLVHVRSTEVTYQIQKSRILQSAEIAKGVITGEAAKPGPIRILNSDALDAARKLYSTV